MVTTYAYCNAGRGLSAIGCRQKKAVSHQLSAVSSSSTPCHPDRSETEWRDLLLAARYEPGIGTKLDPVSVIQENLAELSSFTPIHRRQVLRSDGRDDKALRRSEVAE
jgi:hypothetical protein